MLASLVGSFIYETFGRYFTLIVTNVLMIVFHGIVLINSLDLFFVVKFVEGFLMVYATIVVALFTKELAHPRHALKYQILYYVFVVAGQMINFFSIDDSRVSSWRILFT